MTFLKHLYGDLKAHLLVLSLYSSKVFSENFSYTACRQLSQMFLAILFFHSSEYVIAVNIHGRSNVTLKSLLISKAYLLAIICSLLEYFAEIQLRPCNGCNWEIIRKTAILTAGRSFTHLIKVYHEEDHKLIMLCNPISTIAFAIIVWHFFYKRIPYEEFFLRQFFGSEYEEYAQLCMRNAAVSNYQNDPRR
ncbi:hypothetical protein AAG906_011630 [Vitis piasezkii]